MHAHSRRSAPPASGTGRRPPALRRCWLFLPGAEAPALAAASVSGADVLIQELEDFTPPERRPQARGWPPSSIPGGGPPASLPPFALIP